MYTHEEKLIQALDHKIDMQSLRIDYLENEIKTLKKSEDYDETGTRLQDLEERLDKLENK